MVGKNRMESKKESNKPKKKTAKSLKQVKKYTSFPVITFGVFCPDSKYICLCVYIDIYSCMYIKQPYRTKNGSNSRLGERKSTGRFGS